MLGSAVVSQISVPDLTYAANFIQSRNFRAFEIYIVVTAIYLLLSIALRMLLNRIGRRLFSGRSAARRPCPARLFCPPRMAALKPACRRACTMIEFTFQDIAWNLLLAARWTLLLSLITFVGGSVAGFALLAMRVSASAALRRFVILYVEVFQGTPLLMQLFLGFFGLPLVGIDVTPWVAASVVLTLNASAYLTDIWRGCVDAVPCGQWHAAASLGMTWTQQLRYVVWPQAWKIALPPTVGFLVQAVKSTALTSIIGLTELTKTGNIITNAVFKPFPIYAMVALLYFAMCFPLT